MKKLMMIAVMSLLSMGAFAQAGKFSVGANAGVALYGNEYNPFGIGAKLQYEFVESFRAEAAYNYWFSKTENVLGHDYKAGLMDIDLNLQYLIPAMDKLYIYPLVGVNLGITHGDGDSESIFGFQGGAGVEYYLSDNIKVNFDVKYQYNKKTKTVEYRSDNVYVKSEGEMKYDGPVFQVGIAYVF